MAKETSILVNELYGTVNTTLSNKKNVDELMKNVQQ